MSYSTLAIIQTQGLATITNAQFLKDFNVPEVNKICRKINNYPAILNSGLPSLGSIVKRFGFDFTQAYIEGWIVNLRDFVNVGKKMTDQQTMETAMLILDEYKSITIADINFIFNSAKKGRYGQFYDRLDGQMILSWFDRHFSERCEAAANASIREAESYKRETRSSSFEQINGLSQSKRFK